MDKNDADYTDDKAEEMKIRGILSKFIQGSDLDKAMTEVMNCINAEDAKTEGSDNYNNSDKGSASPLSGPAIKIKIAAMRKKVQ